MTWVNTVKDITTGDRRRDYGHPLTNFLRICLMWSVQLGKPVSPRQFTAMMVTMKMAREVHNCKEDNWIDTIGYSAALEMCNDRMELLGFSNELFEREDVGVHLMWDCYVQSIVFDEGSEEDKNELDDNYIPF